MHGSTRTLGVFHRCMVLESYILAERIRTEWNLISEMKLFGGVALADTKKN